MKTAAGLVISLLSVTARLSVRERASRLYRECQRAVCSPRTDRQTDFQFDQPEQTYLDTDILDQLEQSHRHLKLILEI